MYSPEERMRKGVRETKSFELRFCFMKATCIITPSIKAREGETEKDKVSPRVSDMVSPR